jgi:hypothetical protein
MSLVIQLRSFSHHFLLIYQLPFKIDTVMDSDHKYLKFYVNTPFKPHLLSTQSF